jgi:hypothetical protein
MPNKKQGDIRRCLLCGQHRVQYGGNTYAASGLPRVLPVIAHKATALWFELKVSRDDGPYYRYGQFEN